MKFISNNVYSYYNYSLYKNYNYKKEMKKFINNINCKNYKFSSNSLFNILKNINEKEFNTVVFLIYEKVINIEDKKQLEIFSLVCNKIKNVKYTLYDNKTFYNSFSKLFIDNIILYDDKILNLQECHSIHCTKNHLSNFIPEDIMQILRRGHIITPKIIENISMQHNIHHNKYHTMVQKNIQYILQHNTYNIIQNREYLRKYINCILILYKNNFVKINFVNKILIKLKNQKNDIFLEGFCKIILYFINITKNYDILYPEKYNDSNIIVSKYKCHYDFLLKNTIHNMKMECKVENCNKTRTWIKSKYCFSLYCISCGSEKCDNCNFYRFYKQNDRNKLLKCRNNYCISKCSIDGCSNSKYWIKDLNYYSNYCFVCGSKECHKCNNYRFYNQDNSNILNPCESKLCII